MAIENNLRSGFAIVELLVIVAIVAMLAAILFPVMARSKESGYLTQALSNSKQLGEALRLYSDRYDEALVPSTNYGVDPANPERMWQTSLEPLAKSEEIFVAPSSGGSFARNWEDRGKMSFGYNSATAYDGDQGCSTERQDKSGCVAFSEIVIGSKLSEPANTALFASTPNGDTAKNYRGYEFNPYNGLFNDDSLRQSPPLVGDRDLVAELKTLTADELKPVYCRYMKTGLDEGLTPLVFADGHVKSFSAKEILNGTQKIIWRLR